MSRKRRYVVAGAMILIVAAFAVGNRVADITRTAAGPNQIQSAVLPMADDAVVDSASERSCHPAYVDCIPHDLVKDFDCEDLAITNIRLQHVNWDPYELDRNGDGIGCESS